MLLIRRILFPTDLSGPAAYAWPFALTFAQRFSAEVHLLHVVAPSPQLTEPHAMKFHPEKMVQSLAAKAAASMHQQIEAATARGLIFHCEVRVGMAYRKIVHYAAEHDIDLIVMATHGRTGLAHVLLGSVAEKVARMAPCPVLSIKQPSFRVQDSLEPCGWSTG
ncbi:MAG: universal stress protein [Candidatus Methylomirabilales bacterium]